MRKKGDVEFDISVGGIIGIVILIILAIFSAYLLWKGISVSEFIENLLRFGS